MTTEDRNGWNALEAFRKEMIDHKERMAKLAANFLELDAFEDAAKCAMKAEGLAYVIGRIPQKPINIKI